MINDFLTYLVNLLSFDSSHPLLFTQIHFWVFLTIIYSLFCFIVSVGERRSRRKSPGKTNTMSTARRLWRNGYLFIVSLFFYYKTSGNYVLLLILATVLGYSLGMLFRSLVRKEQQSGRSTLGIRKALMVLGVVVNLAVLCYFKYAYFFTDIFNTIASSHYSIANTIFLPVGISFFTFQNISYIVDTYHGKVLPATNILDFGFYTTFFPQLVAGPIVRADQFVPQLYKPFFLTRRQFGIAVFWILNGLIKKLVLSDYLAVTFVDRIFNNPLLYTPFENFSALLLYSLQVYADFSGYTDIATGVAMLMGFYLPLNFNSPYKATNAAGFWKRWHISLSNWLKDYLYIPLGGNRQSTPATFIIPLVMLVVVALMAKQVWVTFAAVVLVLVLLAVWLQWPGSRKEFATRLNNFDTMLLGGLWHGASFNFITWGALNGLGILVYKSWKNKPPLLRIVLVVLCYILIRAANTIYPCPLFSMLHFAMLVIAIAITVLNIIPALFPKRYHPSPFKNTLTLVWHTFLTFIFISFTRLFFRSGSNLDPAEANEQAWLTATQMVERIGGHWDWTHVPDILQNYASAFIVFVIGMIIHWLPDRFKRRYRLWFAYLPLPLMLLVVVIAVVVIYQFITADLQPFIYFQF